MLDALVPCRSEGSGTVAGAWLFLALARCLAAVWGGLAPLCALQLIMGWGKEVPRSGGARRRRGGGEQEGDLTAATAHFTACHALMAEEIKAGMELFIEINQSPRRRGENNIASSVIPGLQAAARPWGGCRRRCPGSQIRSVQALPVPGKAWPGWGWAACTSPGGR